MTPGGFAWLVRHELRLALRGTGRARTGWRGWLARTAPLLLLAAVPVVGGIGLGIALGVAEPGHRGLGFDVPSGPIGAVVIALFVLMMSTAAIGVLRTFHDRGDLDLLLAAPIPAARVLAAKSVGVAVSVAAPFIVVIAPFGLTRAVLGQPGWIGVVTMVGVDAMLATAIAIVAVGGLVAALGPRPARVVVQLGAAAIGGAVFLATQAPSFAPILARRLFDVAIRPWPTPLDWPARAALGELVPLAAMIGIAVAAISLAARRGARAFVASGDSGRGGAKAQTTTVRFHAGLTRAIVVKELRLIARDPELITQIALRLIYLIPAAALLVRGRHDGGATSSGPAIAAAATAFATLLASSFAWIVVAAEDAPDLLAAAPRTAAVIARAKLIAATAIPLTLVAVAAIAVAAVDPAAAAATLGVGIVAAVTAAQLQAWFGKPAPRSAFRRRAQASFVIGVGELILAAAWAATANLLAQGSAWAAAPALVAAMIIAGAAEARKTAA